MPGFTATYTKYNTHSELTNLEKQLPSPASVEDACRILGIDFTLIQEGLVDGNLRVEVGESVFVAKEEKVIRWLLGKLRESPNTESRLESSVWLLLRILVARLPVSNAAKYLYQFGFTNTLQRTLEEAVKGNGSQQNRVDLTEKESVVQSYASNQSSDVGSGSFSARPQKRKRTDFKNDHAVGPTILPSHQLSILCLCIDGLVKQLYDLSTSPAQSTTYNESAREALQVAMRPDVDTGAKILGDWFLILHFLHSKLDLDSKLKETVIPQIWFSAIGESAHEEHDQFCEFALRGCLLLLDDMRNIERHKSIGDSVGHDQEIPDFLSIPFHDFNGWTFSIDTLYQLIIHHTLKPIERLKKKKKSSGGQHSSLVSSTLETILLKVLSQEYNLVAMLFSAAVYLSIRRGNQAVHKVNKGLRELFKLLMRTVSISLQPGDVKTLSAAQTMVLKNMLGSICESSHKLQEDQVRSLASHCLLVDAPDLTLSHWSVLFHIIQLDAEVFLSSDDDQAEENQLLKALLEQLSSQNSPSQLDTLRLAIAGELLAAFANARMLSKFLDIWRAELVKIYQKLIENNTSHWTPWEDRKLVIQLQDCLEPSLTTNQIKTIVEDASDVIELGPQNGPLRTAQSCARLSLIYIVVEGIQQEDTRAALKGFSTRLFQTLSMQCTKCHDIALGWIWKTVQVLFTLRNPLIEHRTSSGHDEILFVTNLVRTASQRLALFLDYPREQNYAYSDLRATFQASQVVLHTEWDVRLEGIGPLISECKDKLVKFFIEEHAKAVYCRKAGQTDPSAVPEKSFLALDFHSAAEHVVDMPYFTRELMVSIIARDPSMLFKRPRDTQNDILATIFESYGFALEGEDQSLIDSPALQNRNTNGVVFGRDSHPVQSQPVGVTQSSIAPPSTKENDHYCDNIDLWEALSCSGKVRGEKSSQAEIVRVLVLALRSPKFNSSGANKDREYYNCIASIKSLSSLDVEFISRGKGEEILDAAQSIILDNAESIEDHLPNETLATLLDLMAKLVPRSMNIGKMSKDPQFVSLAKALDLIVGKNTPAVCINFERYISSCLEKLCSNKSEKSEKALQANLDSLGADIGTDHNMRELINRPAFLSLLEVCVAKPRAVQRMCSVFGDRVKTLVKAIHVESLGKILQQLASRYRTLKDDTEPMQASQSTSTVKNDYLTDLPNLLSFVRGIASVYISDNIYGEKIGELLRKFSQNIPILNTPNPATEAVRCLIASCNLVGVRPEHIRRAALLLSKDESQKYSQNLLRSVLALYGRSSAEDRVEFINWLASEEAEDIPSMVRFDILKRLELGIMDDITFPKAANSEITTAITMVYLRLCHDLEKPIDARHILPRLEAMNAALQNENSKLSQGAIEGTIGCIVSILSSHKVWVEGAGPRRVYEYCCQLLISILVVFRYRLTGRFHLLMAALQALLSRLFTRYPQGGERGLKRIRLMGTQGETIMGRRQACSFARVLKRAYDPTTGSVAKRATKNGRPNLTSEKALAREQAGERLSWLLPYYTQCQLEGRMSAEVREQIMQGLYAMLDAISADRRKSMIACMSKAQRAVMEGLMKEYSTQGGERFGRHTLASTSS
ncbi:MAG: hypothetical protein M1814_004955 [Vezdaea aestivalis]|nr:MAG: hypothetical protein M1814_004955 [Vezdaea aestivalis]